MPDIDDATAAAAQDIRAALDGQLAGPVGHGTIRLGGRVAARAEVPPAPDATPDPGPVAAGPVGHGAIRLGATIVASSPDDALEGARNEIFAALFSVPAAGEM